MGPSMAATSLGGHRKRLKQELHRIIFDLFLEIIHGHID